MVKNTKLTENVKTINSIKRNLSIYENKTLSNTIKTQLTEKAQIDENKNQWKTTVEKNLGEDHLFDFEIIDGLQQKFGLINAVLNKYADFIVGPGIYVKVSNDKGQIALDKWIKRVNFNKYLYSFTMDALAKGTGTLELTGMNDKTKETAPNNVNVNTIYVVRDKFGKVIRYNQYIGKSKTAINIKDIIGFGPEEIVQFDINKTGSNAYGWGIIYPALSIIDDFLLAQKAIHKLTKRKANVPIHAKIGNAEKDDYPEQSDIDSFGDKLVYLNESTEWVTGPNVEFKLIDFGNIGDKFTTLLENDYKLLSYAFQIPEVLMGTGNVPEGLANVQMDAFERRIKLLQNELSNVLVEKIFKKILNKQGLDAEVEVIWGQPSDDDKKNEIQLLLQVGNISPGMREQCEKKIAELLGFNYEEIKIKNDTEDEKEDMVNGIESPSEDEAEEKVKKKEMEKEEDIKLPIMPGELSKENKSIKGIYAKEKCRCMSCLKEDSKDYSIKEWTNLNIDDYTKQILEVIATDKFKDLAAENIIEKTAGYMSETQINKLKKILSEGFTKQMSIKEVENKLKASGIVKNLYEYNDKGLVLDKNDNKKLIVDKETRAHIIARTEINRVANEGALQSYKDVGIQEVRWISASDDRECDICNDLNGTIMEVANANLPPRHVFCRCSTIPIVKGLTST